MSGIANVVLVVHIFIALALIGVVLLQRSEGGALGIGGGSGSFLSAAGAGNALTRATMILAATFFGTSILLTVLSRNEQHELKLGTQPAAKVTAPATHPGAPAAPISTVPSGALGRVPAAPANAAPGNLPASPPAAPQPVAPPKP